MSASSPPPRFLLVASSTRAIRAAYLQIVEWRFALPCSHPIFPVSTQEPCPEASSPPLASSNLTLFLAFFPHILSDIFSDIFSGTPPDILSDRSGDILLLTFFLTYLPTVFLVYLLAFFLAHLLAFFLTYLSDILSGISPDIFSDILSCALSGILSGISPGISSGVLSGISPAILSDISPGISSDILSGISPDILSDISPDGLSGIFPDILSGRFRVWGLGPITWRPVLRHTWVICSQLNCWWLPYIFPNGVIQRILPSLLQLTALCSRSGQFGDVWTLRICALRPWFLPFWVIV